jgi:error-prone DNA polymerase
MPETHDKPRPSRQDWQDRAENETLPPLVPDEPDPLPAYAELHCMSNFSFQRGASHPQELVERAWDLGYEALAITDECSVAGVVRAWSGLKDYRSYIEWLETVKRPGERRMRNNFKLLYGSEFDTGDGRLVAIAHDLEGWGGLCEFITAARMRADKGRYVVSWDFSDWTLLRGCEILFAPARHAGQVLEDFDVDALCLRLQALKKLYRAHLWLAVELASHRDDSLWLATLREAGGRCGVPLVAAGGVLMHARSRRPLHDVITAVRLGRPVKECGQQLEANAERHMRRRMHLAQVYPLELMRNTSKVVDACRFELESVRYNYPEESVPHGMTPMEALRHFTMEGAARRFPEGIPPNIVGLIDKELKLIGECKYEMFFLTVHDIVREARRQNILCQGRGSAANSVVCYCLGVTEADPRVSHPLLERFISHERRNEPPDIDVDFEHERREDVIQYIYGKYGRHRAAIAAVVICYRTRSAIRDVGMALGIGEPLIDAFAKEHFWFDDGLAVQRLGDLAMKTGDPITPHVAALWLELVRAIKGFPRHLSQHVGGFVLTQTKLGRLVPIENAAMKDRSVIQWDKDDLEDLGLIKVDVLALGMLTAIRRCLDLISARRGSPFTRSHIGLEDPQTYEMIRDADTVGVFQIESRAQMSMLPRLKPTKFYDLVVEVAIVRPGPIQGGMVHPYLKAREKVRQYLVQHPGDEAGAEDAIEYEKTKEERELGQPSRLRAALKRTLGVPIFQEQVMQISMIAAGFDAGKADELRRAMAAWKRKGGVHRFEKQLIDGMLNKGYEEKFARDIFNQMLGFGEYGFPESHAYSFALLAYSSSWLKRHEPEAFLATMLNSQPMGFYSPSQLIQDAKRHGVPVLPADVSVSDYDCTLAMASPPGEVSHAASSTHVHAHAHAPCDRPLVPVRLGLRMIGSLDAKAAQRIVQARKDGPFLDVEDLALRAMLESRDLHALASGDALKSLSGHRRQQVWDASAPKRPTRLLSRAPVREQPLELIPAKEGEEILFDYSSLGFTLRKHPLALLRKKLEAMQMKTSAELGSLPHGRHVAACGLVTVRQQPQTANGTIFVTLEDETGPVNVIVWKHVREAQRQALLHSRLLAVHGTWQRDVDSGGKVCHLVAKQLVDLTPMLGRLGASSGRSRDFH